MMSTYTKATILQNNPNPRQRPNSENNVRTSPLIDDKVRPRIQHAHPLLQSRIIQPVVTCLIPGDMRLRCLWHLPTRKVNINGIKCYLHKQQSSRVA